MIPAMIVPTLMHYDLLQQMLDTVDYPIQHLIVIDNGGEAPEVSCQQAEKITLLRMPTNLGCAASWNLGIKLTPFASWWLIASDDILWTPGSLALYEKFIGKNTMIIESPTMHGQFSGFAVHETLIQQVGLFDEFYFPAIGEEINFMRRLTSLGMLVRAVPGAYTTLSGRTRQSLHDINPKYTAIMLNNLQSAGQGSVPPRGWLLSNRRECDPGPRLP